MYFAQGVDLTCSVIGSESPQLCHSFLSEEIYSICPLNQIMAIHTYIATWTSNPLLELRDTHWQYGGCTDQSAIDILIAHSKDEPQT